MDISAINIYASVKQLIKVVMLWVIFALSVFLLPGFAGSVNQLLLINTAILSVLVIFLVATKNSKKKQTVVTAIFMCLAVSLAASSGRWLELILVSSEENTEEFDKCRSILLEKGEAHEDALAKCGLLY